MVTSPPVRDPPENALVAELARQEALLRELDRERGEAKARLEKLRKQVDAAKGVQSRPPSPPRPATTPAARLTDAAKLRIFRELFRGREDVYPRYWENTAKGKKGYAPACANEWDRALCDKKRVKCGECPNQEFLPVGDQVILDHFHGRHVIGVYPMLEDETCRFLAADFDGASWREDAAAFVETCRSAGANPAVERSRSGEGAHVWFFFTAPVAAGMARRMGAHLLTEAMGRRHQIGMESYDRLFPNQDTMPRGGFGNLIALPFQGKAMKQGNTLFLDDGFNPWPDQWGHLAGVPRLSPAFVEEHSLPLMPPAAGTVRSQRVAGPLPAELNAVLAQRLFVRKAGVPSPLLDRIQRLAAFQNPDFYQKQRMRLSTRGTPRIISCAEDFPDHVSIPRGCQVDLEALLDEHGVKLAIEDERHVGEANDLTFQGELTPIQQAAAKAMLQHDIGVFVAPPGLGKTVLGAYLVAQRRRSTLVLVHRQQLLDQWVAQLSMFLGIDEKEIGIIGGGKKKPNGRLDVAMLQSLGRKGTVDDRVAGYGQVIVDECHHLPAFSFERVLNQVKARYVVGLTATPRRRDGRHPIAEMQLGPARFTVDPRSQAARRPFEHRLFVRDTGFALPSGAAGSAIQDLYRELARDEARNQMIVDDVIRAVEEGRSPILLTERKDHLQWFADRLAPFVRNIVVLQGGASRKEQRARDDRLGSIPDHAERLLLATGRYIGEGFDDARLDTLFLALPISFRGTLVQYTGRLHRLHPRKTEVRIHDYVDRSIPMLLRMFERRLRGYRAIGYAREESPLGIEPPREDPTIEYDEGVMRQDDGEG